MQGKLIYEFGLFRLDPQERRLLRDGQPIGLSPQLFSLLLVFVENPGHLLSKEELRNKMWGKAHVSEDALKVIVGNLRKALSNGENGDHYIENVRGGGYRLAVAVKTFREQMDTPEPRTGEIVPQKAKPATSPISSWAAPNIFAKPAIAKIVLKAAAACLGVIGLLVAANFWKGHNRDHRSNPEPAFSEATGDSRRTSLAVLGFRNLSQAKGEDWLDVALTEMLTTELATGEGFRIIPPDRVARAKRELSFADAGDATPQGLESIRKNLGVDLVVVGSYMVMPARGGADIRLDIRVQDTRTGEAKIWKSTTGKEKNLLAFASDAGRQLREQLGLSELSPEQVRGVQVLFPAHPRAAALYSEGLMKLRSFDALQARVIFQKALEIEPEHPLIHAALATALSSLGYEALAQQEGKTAVSLAQHLPLEERLSVEGQYRRSTKEWDKAIDVYTTLFKYLPSRLEYGLQLANTQTGAGKARDSLMTLENLRNSAAFLDDGRADLAEAGAELVLGNNQLADEAAQRAIKKGNAIGARMLVAEAFSVKANADRYSRQIEAAISASEQAQRIYEQVGDRAGMARALVLRAGALRDSGPLNVRKKLFEQAIAVFDQIGDKSDKARALNALAGVYEDLGDIQTTIAMYQSALRLRDDIGDNGGAAVCLNNIGTAYGTEGDLRRALNKYQEALAWFTKLESRQGIALATGNIAAIYERQGKLAQSREQFEHALVLYRELDSKDNVAGQMESLGNIRLAQGDAGTAVALLRQALAESKIGPNKLLQAEILRNLGTALTAEANFAEAEKAYEEAAALIGQVGGTLSAAENQLGVAELMLAENRMPEAELKARYVVREFSKQHNQDSLLQAREVLAQSLLGTRRCSSAVDEIAHILQLSKRTQDPRLRISATIAAGRIHVACNSPAARNAKAALLHALAETEARGFVALGLEVRLALVEIENQRDQVPEIVIEANRRGFGHVAKRAEMLGGSVRSGVN